MLYKLHVYFDLLAEDGTSLSAETYDLLIFESLLILRDRPSLNAQKLVNTPRFVLILRIFGLFITYLFFPSCLD